MTSSTDELEALRGRIDRIDDQIHDLLIQRSAVVERIAEIKASDRPVMRPAREALILRRILDRHSGRLAKHVVARIWREILAGATDMQAPFTVAAYAPDDQRGLWDICRDHYGSHTQIVATSDPMHPVRMVIDGTAQVGVVPWPDDRAVLPWWSSLVGDSDKLPKIVTRLPFLVEPGANDVQALAIARVPVEPTGEDHGFVVLELRETISRSRMIETLTGEGFAPIAFWTHPAGQHDHTHQHLVEIDGFVAPDDPRLDALSAAFGEALNGVFVLGGFAMPIAVDPEEGVHPAVPTDEPLAAVAGDRP